MVYNQTGRSATSCATVTQWQGPSNLGWLKMIDAIVAEALRNPLESVILKDSTYVTSQRGIIVHSFDAP